MVYITMSSLTIVTVVSNEAITAYTLVTYTVTIDADCGITTQCSHYRELERGMMQFIPVITVINYYNSYILV